jgi:ABC-type multidrug transport system, ATPase component
MQNVIQLEGVTKTYGSSRGVTDISLQVPEGSIYGFLGPNGAGKTTTISMLVNLTHPSAGSIKIFGEDNETNGLQHRKRIGFLAGDMALDKALTGWQQLEYFGHLRGNFDAEYVRDLAKRLNAQLHKKIKSLSRGNRQKIGLIAALMHKPDLLILDEPTSGLDPLIQAEFNKIILEHKQEGKTTFISSHVLSEVQELCDQVAIIRDGKIVTHKSMQEIIDEAPRVVTVSSPHPHELDDITKGLQGVSNLHHKERAVSFNFSGDMNDLIKRLAKKPISNLAIEDTDLEQIFISYYQDDKEQQNV